MTSPTLRRLATAAALVVLFGFSAHAADPPAAAAPKGDLWQVTSQMSMEGVDMAMPAQTVKVCSPKTWTEAPGGADERHKCQNTDFKIDGPKATWKTVCAGPPQMTGVGEVTRDGADAYAGTIKFTSDGGNMTIKLTGKRLSECDVK